MKRSSTQIEGLRPIHALWRFKLRSDSAPRSDFSALEVRIWTAVRQLSSHGLERCALHLIHFLHHVLMRWRCEVSGKNWDIFRKTEWLIIFSFWRLWTLWREARKDVSNAFLLNTTLLGKGGVPKNVISLEKVFGFEDTFWSPWPWTLQVLKNVLSSARRQHYFLISWKGMQPNKI